MGFVLEGLKVQFLHKNLPRCEKGATQQFNSGPVKPAKNVYEHHLREHHPSFSFCWTASFLFDHSGKTEKVCQCSRGGDPSCDQS